MTTYGRWRFGLRELSAVTKKFYFKVNNLHLSSLPLQLVAELLPSIVSTKVLSSNQIFRCIHHWMPTATALWYVHTEVRQPWKPWMLKCYDEALGKDNHLLILWLVSPSDSFTREWSSCLLLSTCAGRSSANIANLICIATCTTVVPLRRLATLLSTKLHTQTTTTTKT